MMEIIWMVAKMFILCYLLKGVFWIIARTLREFNKWRVVLVFLSLAATASAQDPEYTDAQLHSRNVEIVLFGGFGAILASGYFQSWKR